jgi:hypothetical protein
VVLDYFILGKELKSKHHFARGSRKGIDVFCLSLCSQNVQATGIREQQILSLFKQENSNLEYVYDECVEEPCRLKPSDTWQAMLRRELQFFADRREVKCELWDVAKQD